MFFSKKDIPVLLYHQIGYQKNRLSITPEQFESHIKIIKRLGFSPIFLDELMDILATNRQTTSKFIAITFDDGDLSNWVYAYPLLKKYKIKATFFIVTSWVLDEGMRDTIESVWSKKITAGHLNKLVENETEVNRSHVSWDELIQMEKSGLADIQPHGHKHISVCKNNLYKNDNLSKSPVKEKNKVLLEDISVSKAIIENKLKKECRHFAWPRGEVCSDIIQLLPNLGISASYSIELGSNNSLIPRYALRRITIKRWFAYPIKFMFFFWLFSNNTIKKIKANFSKKYT